MCVTRKIYTSIYRFFFFFLWGNFGSTTFPYFHASSHAPAKTKRKERKKKKVKRGRCNELVWIVTSGKRTKCLSPFLKVCESLECVWKLCLHPKSLSFVDANTLFFWWDLSNTVFRGASFLQNQQHLVYDALSSSIHVVSFILLSSIKNILITTVLYLN